MGSSAKGGEEVLEKESLGQGRKGREESTYEDALSQRRLKEAEGRARGEEHMRVDCTYLGETVWQDTFG